MNSHKSIVVSSLVWSIMERVLIQGIVFVVSLFIARQVSPNIYGIYGLLTVVITFSIVLSTLGLDKNYLRMKDDDNCIFNEYFSFSFILSWVFYFALFVLSDFINESYFDYFESFSLVIKIAALRIPLTSYYNLQNSYIVVNSMLRKSFFSSLISILFYSLFGLFLAYNGYGIYALVIPILVQLVISIVLNQYLIKFLPKFVGLNVIMNKSAYVGIKIMLSMQAIYLYEEVRILYIGSKFNYNDVGYYNRGKSFPYLISTNFTLAINKIYINSMSKFISNREKLKYLICNALSVSSLLISPVLVGMFIIIDDFVLIVLGEIWMPATLYAKIMIGVYYFFALFHINTEYFNSNGMSNIYLKMNLLRVFVGLITILLSIFIWGTLIAITFSLFIEVIVTYFLSTIYIKKYIGVSYFKQIYSWVIPLLFSLMMGFILILIGDFNVSVFLNIIIKSIIGFIFYFSMLIVFRNKTFRYLINSLHNFIKEIFIERKREI